MEGATSGATSWKRSVPLLLLCYAVVVVVGVGKENCAYHIGGPTTCCAQACVSVL